LDQPNGDISYSIRLPVDLADTYIDIVACNQWVTTEEEHRRDKVFNFENAINADRHQDIQFTFPHSDRDTSFVTIEGWKGGKQIHCRIWLGGFHGITAVAQLEKLARPWGQAQTP
jgi:hypothetical protein